MQTLLKARKCRMQTLLKARKCRMQTPAEGQKVLDAIPLLKARKCRMLCMINTNAFFSKFHQNSQMKFHPLNLVKTARLDLNPHGVIPRQPRSKVKLHTEAEVCNSISKIICFGFVVIFHIIG